LEISVVVLSHDDMRRAVTKYLCDVLGGQVQVNSIKTMKGQRGFAIDLAIFEPDNLGEDAVEGFLPPRGSRETNPFAPEDAHPNAVRYPIAEEG